MEIVRVIAQVRDFRRKPHANDRFTLQFIRAKQGVLAMINGIQLICVQVVEVPKLQLRVVMLRGGRNISTGTGPTNIPEVVLMTTEHCQELFALQVEDSEGTFVVT